MLCARGDELIAMVAALRAEEGAALKALRDEVVLDTWRRREARQRASSAAWAAVSAEVGQPPPLRGERADRRAMSRQLRPF